LIPKNCLPRLIFVSASQLSTLSKFETQSFGRVISWLDVRIFHDINPYNITPSGDKEAATPHLPKRNIGKGVPQLVLLWASLPTFHNVWP